MSEEAPSEPGLREKLSQRGEEAIGDLAQNLLENPVFNQALQAAFGAREKAVQAQQAAMGALNLPSAADIERLTRRVRAVSQRLEGVEDGIDRLEERLGAAGRAAGSGGSAGGGAGGTADPAVGSRLAAIESRLEDLARDLTALRKKLASNDAVSRDQESLGVSES